MKPQAPRRHRLDSRRRTTTTSSGASAASSTGSSSACPRATRDRSTDTGLARPRHAPHDPRRRVVRRRRARRRGAGRRTAPTTTTCAQLVERHARRCPSRQVSSAPRTRSTLARFHRIAAADVHGDRAHRRGVGPRRPARRPRLQDRRGCVDERLAEIPAAKVQAFVLGQAARDRGLTLRLRYEYLQRRGRRRPRAVGARRRRPRGDRGGAARRGRAHVARRRLEGRRRRPTVRGVPYRSICRDSVAPSEPTWPVLVTGGEAPG